MHSSRLAHGTAVRSDAWGRWVPNADEPWSVDRVVHLHKRAGFGCIPAELNRCLVDGPDASIDRILRGEVMQGMDADEFDRRAASIAQAASRDNSSSRLQAWWIFRMVFSPDPLGERLTLLWHNHFATSNAKVENVFLMYQQNQVFREHRRSEYGQLLMSVMQDPAILIFLDANSNKATHPNENLGREMLELFTLGEGNYTESDVRSAARSLTGWTVSNERFQFDKTIHDTQAKQFLGQSGNLQGEDAVRIAASHPATARRVVWRICQMLFGEGVVSEHHLEDLTDQFQEQHLDIDWLVETILRSNLFFSEGNLGNRIVSGIEFVVGTLRSLNAATVPPLTTACADWASKMGHRLFYPPSVFGFPAGREWITSQWLIIRQAFVNELFLGRLHKGDFEPMEHFKASLSEHSELPVHDTLQALFHGSRAFTRLSVDDGQRTDSDMERVRDLLMSPYAHLG